MPFYFQPGGHKCEDYHDMQDLSFIKLGSTLLVAEGGRFFPQCHLPSGNTGAKANDLVYNP